jgi:hypothetical protein
MSLEIEKPRLYYFPETRDRKAVLIFDSGYSDENGKRIGNIHIYELKETLPASQVIEQVKKYGHYLDWYLSYQDPSEIRRKAIEEYRRNPLQALSRDKPHPNASPSPEIKHNHLSTDF